MLWKNKNTLIFEGLSFCGLDTMEKIIEDSNQWFLAQPLDRLDMANDLIGNFPLEKRWSPPLKNWVKCNIGYAWNKTSQTGGTVSIIRNDVGTVLLHGRRSFSFVNTKQDVSLESWLWAVESFKTLRFSKVFFAAEDKELIGAVSRPLAWISYKYQSTKILSVLESVPFWKLQYETKQANLGATRIANSVTAQNRLQS